MPVADDIPPVFSDAVPDLAHRGEDGFPVLVRRQQRQALCAGQFDVDAHPVGEHSHPFDQPRVGTGNRLGMDVAVKAVLKPQNLQSFNHLFACVVGIAQNTGRDK